MKFTYDGSVDAGYVTISRDRTIASTTTVPAGDYIVNLDLDDSGNLLGVEIV